MTTVLIHGQSVELEERICSGGCGCKFKVMPSSKVTTARMDCQQVCFGEKWAQMQTRFKDKVKAKRELKKAQGKKIDPEVPMEDQPMTDEEEKKKRGRPHDHYRKHKLADRRQAAKEFLGVSAEPKTRNPRPGSRPVGRPPRTASTEQAPPQAIKAPPEAPIIPRQANYDPLAAPSSARTLFWDNCVEKVKEIFAAPLTYNSFVEMAVWIELAVAISLRDQDREIQYIAEQIKVEPETMHGWIKIKSRIYPNLSDCNNDYLLAKIADRVQEGMSNSDIQSLFKEESKHLVNKCLSDLIKIEDLICRSSLDISVLSGDELNKFQSALAGLSKTLKAKV